MKKVLFVTEKHVNRIFDISTPELSEKAYLEIFKERLKEGEYRDYIYQPFFDYASFKTLTDGKIARKFILYRSQLGYEYERVEEIEVEKV